MSRGFPTQSPIARLIPSSRPAAQIEEERQKAKEQLWHEMGIATIDPEDVDDDFVRQGIINQANKQYGRRGRNG